MYMCIWKDVRIREDVFKCAAPPPKKKEFDRFFLARVPKWNAVANNWLKLDKFG